MGEAPLLFRRQGETDRSRIEDRRRHGLQLVRDHQLEFGLALNVSLDIDARCDLGDDKAGRA